MRKAQDITSYLTQFPQPTQILLEQLRQTIKKAAPLASEVISYGMPAYKGEGMLVYFAGYKNHIGFYPTAAGISYFEKELGKFKWSKGAVQFPLNKQLPLQLITKIVKYRVKQDQEKSLTQKLKRK